MAELKLLRGETATVDDALLPELSKHTWRLHSSGYVIRSTGSRSTLHIFWLHHAVSGVPRGVKVDHRDRNKLNNLKENLRAATTIQNGGNRSRNSNSKSPYKGVKFKAARKGFRAGWEAWIKHAEKTKKQKYLGFFESAEEAAIAYNSAALELFGEFASLNEVSGWPVKG